MSMATMTPAARPWLWPDREIGKRESRKLREEHNRAVNEHAEMLAVLLEITEHGTDDWDARMKTVRAAIAKAVSP